MDPVIEKILTWAKEQTNVRAVILLGSRALGKQVDQYSDYDISLFCEDFSFSEDWMSVIGAPLVWIPEKQRFFGETFPARLVVYEGGYNVDFATFSLEMLKKLVIGPLPEVYNLGYKVLLDKDHLTNHLPAPSMTKQELPPTEAEFTALVDEFWFERFQINKYKKRGDLWSASSREADVKYCLLLQMIRWHEKCIYGTPTRQTGKNMHQWLNQKTWEELLKAEGEKSVPFFLKLAKEVGDKLGYQVKDLSKCKELL